MGPTAESRIQGLIPRSNIESIRSELSTLFELVQIRREGEIFPSLEYEEIEPEIKLLPIHNASISLEGFMRIHRASTLVNALIYFFDKREEDFPLLHELTSQCYYTKEITDAIERVFDRSGAVRDDASDALLDIRNSIRSVRKQINRNFDREMRRLQKANVLGETRETFLNERRVLTILSQHKRKIEGTVVGSSKTGSLTYIEPQVNVPLNNELELLLDDERKEIFRILQVLRKELLEHIGLISSYQQLLTEFDFINAKSKLALKTEGYLPQISDERTIELIDAYHPILRSNNDAQKKPTIAQKVSMDTFSRMLVISGPNAGGKSITLKSIGLLQVMLQCGLLVPVHENSVMCVFQKILSDIGDNQSIANELSTYSYRLKRMNTFLEVANRNTLLLLDEFGTGSDPDLGGALAETIFEWLYNKKCFGVITTHYANIKLKADQLRNAVNGCMLFNAETLDPLYVFSSGQPGSSFTFEVAEINGIPKEIIEEAKQKLDDRKVKMDRLLTELQKEKNYLNKLNKEHIEAQALAESRRVEFEEKRSEYEGKLKSFRSSAESNNKWIQLGKKMQGFVDRYALRSKKKTINDPLMEDIRTFLAREKSKIEEEKVKTRKEKQQTIKKNHVKKQVTPQKDPYRRDKIKVGSRVKLISTRQTGQVEDMSGENVIVTFGFARMKVTKDKLMWVE